MWRFDSTTSYNSSQNVIGERKYYLSLNMAVGLAENSVEK